MDFTKRLTLHSEPSYGMRLFQHLDTESGVAISIQASQFHYCSPRETLADLSKYEAFEIGLPLNPRDLPEDFPIPRDLFESSDPTATFVVAGFVPREVVQRAVDYLDRQNALARP